MYGSLRPRGAGDSSLSSFLSDPFAAVPLYDPVRNHDFGGELVRVFQIAQELIGGFLAQLDGIDVHRGELGRCQLGVQGIVEGDDGHILRDGQLHPCADPFQSQGQHIIADHEGCGPVLPCEQSLQGCAFAMAGIIHLRLHSFGNLEFLTRVPMSLEAGLAGDIVNFLICCVAFLVIGYFVAYFMIGKLKLATPGRLGNYTDAGEGEEATADAPKATGDSQAQRIITLLGGRENIVLVDACMTRLRVTVKDAAKVADLAAWKAEGALSLLVKDNGIQAVYGPKADVLKSDINDIL